jgi:multidrug efflux pump subunit AcrB
MGSLMCIGLTSANSILVVTFANQRMEEGDDKTTAAIMAGYTRLRPVMMTAGAMILGMIPMALGVGEGGEQNAPLARAVIGGLMFATVATLIFVPVVYRLLRSNRQPASHFAARAAAVPAH